MVIAAQALCEGELRVMVGVRELEGAGTATSARAEGVAAAIAGSAEGGVGEEE